MIRDHLPVIGRVMRRDEDAVVAFQRRRRQLDAVHLQVVVPHLVRLRHVRIVVIDVCAEFLELFDQLEAGAFAHIIDIRLIRQAQHENRDCL